jgi:Domain of unknown function (DUF1735)
MKKISILRFTMAFAVAGLLFNACKKADSPAPLQGEGNTIIKLESAAGEASDFYSRGIDFINTSQTIIAIQVRRDCPNNAELQKAMTVVVKDDPGAVSAYNGANGTSMVSMSPTLYTISPAKSAGGKYTVTFAPGEFSKSILLTIPDASVLNVNSSYGFGFTLESADAGGKLTNEPNKTVVLQIGAKNQFDGLYKVTGSFYDVVFPVFLAKYPLTYALVTSGATTCDVINVNLNGGIPGYNFDNAGTPTFYGSYGYVIGFSPTTGACNTFYNYYGDPSKPATGGGNPALGTGPPAYRSSNTRTAVLDPSGANSFNFGNHNITIKHWMIQTNQPTGTQPRAYFDETWTYIGPR